MNRQLGEHIAYTDKQFSELRKALRLERQLGSRAWNAVARVESRWESEKSQAFPPLLRAVLAANELYWSDFGAFLRLNGTDGRDAAVLRGHARDTLATLVGSFAAEERRGPATIEDWLSPLVAAAISADQRDGAVYLLEDSPREVQPLAASAAVRLRGEDGALPDRVPKLMLPKHLGEVAVREVVRRIETEDGGRGPMERR